MSDVIRQAMDSATAWVRDHQDEARYTDSVATARLESGLRVSVSGPSGELLATDMPKAVGGGASAISPGWAFRAAAAACVLSLATMRAAQQAIDGFRCEVDVDSESDDRGILGLDESVPAGPLSVRIVVRMSASAAGREQLGAIATWAVEHCPVSESLARQVPVTVDVTPGRSQR